MSNNIIQADWFMASHKGTTGPTAATRERAAQLFFERYTNIKKCIVCPVIELPGNRVIAYARGERTEHKRNDWVQA